MAAATITLISCSFVVDTFPRCVANECDDNDLCTEDVCMVTETTSHGYICVNTPVDCGENVCDPADGTCVDCLAHADCDNGEFCDGAEICFQHICLESDGPCDAASETCDEIADTCVPIASGATSIGETSRARIRGPSQKVNAEPH